MKRLSLIATVLLVLVLGSLSCVTSVPSGEDYLSALEGLVVTTTMYHDEVIPPPLGTKYPPTFYEPMLIGRVPASIKGSVALAPYGQPRAQLTVEPDWFREGQTLDILFEANKPGLWQLDKPDAVAVYANFGVSGVSAETFGLLDSWGFFYEGEMTEIQTESGVSHKYSTALRVIAWKDEYLELRFRNFSPEAVEVSYSIWRGGFVPNFVNDYGRAWEKYWESSEVTEEEILKMKRDMERYLAEKRQ